MSKDKSRFISFGRINHYKWLEEYLVPFFKEIGLNTDVYHNGLIGAHGDKCYAYRYDWEDNKIPFERGVLIYLLTYCKPYSETVRQTPNGWIDPCKWVVDLYPRFKEIIDTIEET